MRTPSSKKCRLDIAPPWADRFILGVTPSITARYFSAGPSDSTSRWTPCPPKYNKRWLQVGLGCIRLSPLCPFRRLHTFHFLRPARLRTPLLGYGAPHLSARGTSTLLNNALLSAHFLFADHSAGTDEALISVYAPSGRHRELPERRAPAGLFGSSGHSFVRGDIRRAGNASPDPFETRSRYGPKPQTVLPSCDWFASCFHRAQCAQTECRDR